MVNVSKLTGQLKVRGFKLNMVRKKFHWHKLDSSLTTIQLWYAKNIKKKKCFIVNTTFLKSVCISVEKHLHFSKDITTLKSYNIGNRVKYKRNTSIYEF